MKCSELIGLSRMMAHGEAVRDASYPEYQPNGKFRDYVEHDCERGVSEMKEGEGTHSGQRDDATEVVLEVLFNHMSERPEWVELWQAVELLWPEEYHEFHRWYGRG